jgi:restriction system protein
MGIFIQEVLMESSANLPRRGTLTSKAMYAALQILHERGGQVPYREVIAGVGRRVKFNDWEKGTLEKSGDIRWRALLNIDSIYYVKAGFLRKNRGIWHLTPKGQSALQHGEVKLYKDALAAYRNWLRGG